jgi:hypothetical protein
VGVSGISPNAVALPDPRAEERDMSTLNDDEITTGGPAQFEAQGGGVADADQDDADGTDDSDQSDDADDADADDPSVGPADSAS